MERYSGFDVWFVGRNFLGQIMATFRSTAVTHGKNIMDLDEINICRCQIPANYFYVNNVWFQHVY